MLTGDTLFVGDVARPDLAIDKTDGARDIFHSLREKLLTLPAETEVWPGHLGGSMCGSAAMSPKISSTIGYELRANELLSVNDEERFVEASLARIGEQPPNFENIVEINRGSLLTETIAAKPLTPRQLERRVAEGAFLVDIRTSLQFDDAHIEGATLITILEAGFGSKLAWLADPEQEIVFVGRDDADGQRAVLLAQSVGLNKLAASCTAGSPPGARRGGPRCAPSGSRSSSSRGAMTRARRSRSSTCARPTSTRAATSRARSSVPWHDIDAIPNGLAKTQADRGDLRLGQAGRRRRQPAAALRRRAGDPRDRRWRAQVGGARRPGRALRLLSRPLLNSGRPQ